MEALKDEISLTRKIIFIVRMITLNTRQETKIRSQTRLTNQIIINFIAQKQRTGTFKTRPGSVEPTADY